MGLFSSLVGLGFGGAPKIPKLPAAPTPQQAQQTAIAGNQAALPGAETLGTGVNAYNASEYEKMFQTATGGYYDKIRGSVMQNAMDLIQGKVPKTAIDQLMSDTAARSLYGGFGGTGLSRNLFVNRRLDQILGAQAAGQNSFMSWLNATKSPVFDVSKMFISPEFQYTAGVNERNAQAQWNATAKMANYGNDPMRGVEGAVGGVADYFGAQLSAYLGNKIFPGSGGGSGGGATPYTDTLLGSGFGSYG